MKVVRFIVAEFSDVKHPEFDHLSISIGSVSVTAQRDHNFDRHLRIVIIGSLRLGTDVVARISSTDSRTLPVPFAEREIVEQALEFIADSLAVMFNAARRIWTADPEVALEWEDDTEAKMLKGRLIEGQKSLCIDGDFTLDCPEGHIAYLADRLGGAKMLAETIAHTHPMGKYREIMRLFEAAFNLSPTQLPKKLSQFLGQTPYGFTRPEVSHWCSLRNLAIHGNTTAFHHERHVLRLIPRMIHAAYDVLFNKDEWGVSSRVRRDVFQPTAAYSNAECSNLVMLRGSTTGFKARKMDRFGVYEMHDSVMVVAEFHPWAHGLLAEFDGPDGMNGQ